MPSDNPSFSILQQRWSDPKLLEEASKRRDHLNYEKISFGAIDDEKLYIISLLPQAHCSYYMGHYQGCVVMCGTILEAMMQKVVHEAIKKEPILLNLNRDAEQPQVIMSKNDVDELSLNLILKIFKDKHWLNLGSYNSLFDLREIRNITIHDKLPLFSRDEKKKVYFLDLERGFYRKIEIPAESVVDISEPSEQITAWYTLKTARELLKEMVKIT
jgi:hypothetical protein